MIRLLALVACGTRTIIDAVADHPPRRETSDLQLRRQDHRRPSPGAPTYKATIYINILEGCHP